MIYTVQIVIGHSAKKERKNNNSKQNQKDSQAKGPSQSSEVHY